MDLMLQIYSASEGFPKREMYSLTDQIRRAAVSAPSNIVEGQAHHSNREFKHFLRHSLGSLAKMEIQLIIAERPGCVAGDRASQLLCQVAEAGRIINGLISSIDRSVAKSAAPH